MDADSCDVAGEHTADDWRWPPAGVATTTMDSYGFRFWEGGFLFLFEGPAGRIGKHMARTYAI